MKTPAPISDAWLEALRQWLAEGDETSLLASYRLGRRALAEGFGPLALSEVHARALAACPPPVRRSDEAATAAWRFFTEALAPAELALRGYSDTVGELQQLNRTLEARVEERSLALMAAEQRYRALIEQLPVVTYSAPLAPTGATMSYISPQIAVVTGYAPEEWLALPGRWGGRLHPEDVERVESALLRSVSGGGPFQVEYRLLRKDGSVAWVRDEARRSGPAEGAHHQGIWLEVTEQRALEAQLRQAQKLDALGRLAGGIAHDFNNLLTAILSFGRFVSEDLGPEHPSQQDITEVLRSAERAAGLTRQLLAFSRNQSFRPQPVALEETVRGMEKLLTRLLGERVQLSLRVAEKAHLLEADLSQIEQVILNLVVNSGDAMPEGGRLTIEVANVTLDGQFVRGQLGAPPGEYVMLAVSDTGVGIDAETQRRIFEPFFTTKAPGKGTGLGLSTVYGVIRQLGGDLLIYSTVGVGTTFKVFFPRARGEWSGTPPAEPSGEVRGTETVLLVEDDVQVREVSARALRACGFEVLEAESVAAAVALSQRHPGEIHLLLSDVMLAGDTGLQVAKQVIAQRPGTRLLFMSGYTEQALQRQGKALAGAQFIDKPFTPARLARTVRSLLDAAEPQKDPR